VDGRPIVKHLLIVFVIGTIAGVVLGPIRGLAREGLEQTAWGRGLLSRLDGFFAGEWP
jgi:hypothetical protein